MSVLSRKNLRGQDVSFEVEYADDTYCMVATSLRTFSHTS